MNKALLEKPVKELTTAQLRDVYEHRLVDEGLASIKRGDYIEVTPRYFDALRDLAKETRTAHKEGAMKQFDGADDAMVFLMSDEPQT